VTQPRTNGHLVRAIRLARGLRQDHVANRAGCSKSYVANIEAGRKNPPLSDKLRGVAVALGVDPRVLTGQIPPVETLREIGGFTVRELAQRAGITSTQLRRIEQGADTPNPALAAVLAARLGCPIEVLTFEPARPEGETA
jgi:transcriptional regulator with XRE-family HTH domain